MKRQLVFSPAFIRDAKRLTSRNQHVRDDVEKALQILQSNAFDPRLKTHKLKGGLAGNWASTAGYDLRIIFRFITHLGAEAILLKSIGTHDDVY
jgi:mRNA-degrading endonuclease YafQ of YafQ-DinJ toxin-antitoxin module